jgi:hypothetical protein
MEDIYMKRIVMAMALIAAMLIGIPTFAAETEKKDPTYVYIFADQNKEHGLALEGSAPARDVSGNPCLAIMFTYVNQSSEARMPMAQYFVTCYQKGVQLQTAFTLDSDLSKFTSASTTQVKDGGYVAFAELYKLNDETSPVEVEVSDSLFGGSKVTFTVDPTRQMYGNEIMGTEAPAEDQVVIPQTEEPETEIDWEAKYYDLLEKYNALLEQRQ